MNHEDTQSQIEESVLFPSASRVEESLSLAQELTDFSDKFTEFLCVNSFLNESLAVLMSELAGNTSESARGARYCIDALHLRSSNLKSALDRFRQRYLAEAQVRAQLDAE